MPKLAIIGNSHLAKLSEFIIHRRQNIRTPYGLPDAPVLFGKIEDFDVAFFARHGLNNSVAPEHINYRANIWALKEIGADAILSMASVCAVDDRFAVGSLVIPHDLMDYTAGRADTFADGRLEVQYVDFRQPYDEHLRQRIIKILQKNQIPAYTEAIYACTQGNRSLTRAEMRRLKQDGADIYGMTGMPEAVLARELHIPYIHVCGVVGNASDPNLLFSTENPHHQTVSESIRQLLLQLNDLNHDLNQDLNPEHE